MPTLPPSSDITGSTITEGQAKTWLAAVRTFIATFLGTAGTQTEALTAIGAPMNASVIKSGAYTAVEADRGKVLKCNGTWSLSLTAAATLGDGWNIEIANDGAGTITIDPYVSETINGATTKTIAAGSSAIIYCDGTKFVTLGGGVTSAEISTALGYTPANAATLASHNHSGVYVPVDTGATAIGGFIFAYLNYGAAVPNGSLIAGSLLYYTDLSGTALALVNFGTWRCCGYCQAANSSLFQRIA